MLSFVKIKLKDFQAFHLQSKGFGFHLENCHVDYVTDSIYISNSKGFKKYSLPQYFQRKLYYSVYSCPVTNNNLYRLNDTGILHKAELFKSRINSQTNIYASLVEYLVSNNCYATNLNFDILSLNYDKIKQIATFKVLQGYEFSHYKYDDIEENFVFQTLDNAFINNEYIDETPRIKSFRRSFVYNDDTSKHFSEIIKYLDKCLIDYHIVTLKEKEDEFNSIKKIKDFIKMSSYNPDRKVTPHKEDLPPTLRTELYSKDGVPVEHIRPFSCPELDAFDIKDMSLERQRASGINLTESFLSPDSQTASDSANAFAEQFTKQINENLSKNKD